MKKKIKSSKNQENTVNHIVNPHLVIKWGSHKKHLVDHIKIVTSNICFFQKKFL